MKKYVDLVLKREKKAIALNKVYLKVENRIKKDDSNFVALSEEQKSEIQSILENGVNDYSYFKTPKGNYSHILNTSFRVGRFHANKNGDGNVLVTTGFVKAGNHIINTVRYPVAKQDTSNAIDGDKVLIDLSEKDKPRVLEILERNLNNIIGEVYRLGSHYYVKPIDKKKSNITIALDGDAIEGQRVDVKLTKQNDSFYKGEIVRVFNHKDDPDEDILWEAFKCGIDDKFSAESLEQVKGIPLQVSDSDKIGRHDLTDWEIFTIDGEDTKDIDDALSCKRLENGNYLVGVHIADVSYYVSKDSPLDKDAFKRGTSNYLASKVIPMLPHELSNGICSLNPYTERLAISCIMEVTPEGKVINHSIVPSVIRSRLKMTYTKVNEILKNSKVDSEYEDYADTLIMLNKLALILRKNRFLSGAIEFDKPELKLILGEDGKVKDFSVRTQDLAENLIEEFMLLANETVDKHLVNSGAPCLHRVHDVPNEKRLIDYFKLLDAVNYTFYKYSSEECSQNHKALQALAEHIKDTGRLSNVLSTNLVRCMSRAKYSPDNIGHYGLAKNNYCHFTSPIRRYPDLTIHRLIKDCIFDKENAEKNCDSWCVKLPEIGEQSSKMERIADKAEQQALYMKCSEYMEQHIGEEYEGTVIDISNHGIQVQLDNMVEGKVRFRNLSGGYVYNPDTFTLVSMDGKPNYYIGDRLLVKVVDASKENKIIDFQVVKKLEENYIPDKKSTNQYVKTNMKKQRAMNHSKRK